MDHLSEQFGARLVRVIKNVKRRTSSGGTKTVRQSFHVKQANPGDQYAGAKTRNVGALGASVDELAAAGSRRAARRGDG